MNVAIVDDHEIFRMGLRLLLTSMQEIDAVLEFDSGLKMLESHAKSPLEMLVIDFSMPDYNGLEILRKLDDLPGKPRIILLTASASTAILKEARSLGASGLVAKRGSGEEVLLAVKAVTAGQDFVSPEFSELLQQSTLLDSLTGKEMQVLQLILAGKSTKEAAVSLNVAFKTADTHRSRVMQKLNVHSLSELLQLGRENGLLREV